MCGIVGIVATSPVNQSLYDALTVLQHRGQDAAGIVTVDDGNFKQRKANGLVKDVFETKHMYTSLTLPTPNEPSLTLGEANLYLHLYQVRNYAWV